MTLHWIEENGDEKSVDLIKVDKFLDDHKLGMLLLHALITRLELVWINA